MTNDDVATFLCDVYEREWSEQVFLIQTLLHDDVDGAHLMSSAVHRWININAEAVAAYFHTEPQERPARVVRVYRKAKSKFWQMKHYARRRIWRR